jgi:cell division protein YceG involved in septum cleavage
MKNIAVLCNNRAEWRHFVETLQFTLSKENKRYKAVAEAIVDIDKQVKYLYVTNHKSGIAKMRGVTVNDYLTMASIVDNDIHEYLMTNMRGE